jgi:5-methylcytosine-specific restriction protein B
MIVKSGLGIGRFADVPWVAVLNDKFGGRATEGYYVVFLFSKDSERIYLSVGVGAGSGTTGGWTLADRKRVESNASKLRSRCKQLSGLGFELSGDIDLATDVWRAKSYATATAAFKCYETPNLPTAKQIEEDFLNAFRCFASLIREGFDFDSATNDDPVTTFANTPVSRALISKPFLILTGPSGTGKTRGAIELAENLCDDDCRALVAVGADWTDNRHVVGFLNPLHTVDGTPKGKPIYETTAILNLLLHANAQENRDKPHVLILDEMNLSHVERYFADFLSAMELHDKQKALKLHTAGLAKTREGEDVEGCIDFPENLFVIGTVNIDETTYMFSPKVLDRANVIEIHADETALGNFLRDGTEQEGSEAQDYGISFLDLARVIRREEPSDESVPLLPHALRIAAAERLMDLFEIMKRGRGEFGFRTGREVLAYLRTAYFLTPEAERTAWAAPDGDWLKALDAQILQKILPKLHGSRTRLAPLLGALATYCATGTKAYAMEHFPEGGNSPRRGLSASRNISNPKFEHSYKKLERMIEVLVEEQFVSFIC